MKKLRRIIALILTLTIMSSVAAVGSTNVFAADVEESSVGEVTLNKDTLLEIQKYTRGLDSTFGKILYYGGAGVSVLKVGYSILEMTGVIESQHAAIMRRFNEIEFKIDQVQKTLDEHTKSLLRIEKKLYQNENKQVLRIFKEKVDNMNLALQDMQDLYKTAKAEYATEVAIVGEPLPEDMVKNHIKPKKWLDIDNASPEEICEYCDTLTNIIITGCANNHTDYYEYSSARERLLQNFQLVTSAFTDEENPLDVFDNYCTMAYNFDSQAYYPRVFFRETLLSDMTETMAMIHMLYRSYKNPNNSLLKTHLKRYQAAATELQTNRPAGKDPSEIAAYQHLTVNPNEKYNGEYISDIKIAGNKDSSEKARKILTDQGYTVIGYDLNRNASGYFIYLGVKTTTDYNKAIKDVVIQNNYRPKTWYNANRNYYECEHEGCSGDLNQGAGGDFLYLYYTKDEMNDGTAIKSLMISGINARNHICDTEESGYYVSVPEMHKNSIFWRRADLNRGVEVWGFKETEILLTKVLAQKADYMVDDDPEYYPYCYALNSKVSFHSIDGSMDKYELKAFTNPGGTLMDADTLSVRNWTLSEEETFRSQMTESTLKEELKSAGIDTNCTLLTSNNRNASTARFMVGNENIITEKKGNHEFDVFENNKNDARKVTAEPTGTPADSEKIFRYVPTMSSEIPAESMYIKLHDSSDYTGKADVYKLGDANRDGVVDITDVTLIQLHLAELKTLEGKYMKAAMINNGELSINDATEIQKYLAQYSDVNPFVDTYSI